MVIKFTFPPHLLALLILMAVVCSEVSAVGSRQSGWRSVRYQCARIDAAYTSSEGHNVPSTTTALFIECTLFRYLLLINQYHLYDIIISIIETNLYTAFCSTAL